MNHWEKNLTLRSFETGNLSADNFKKYSTSMRVGGSLQILQSDWFRKWAVFYDLAPLNRAELLAASFTSLVVVCE